MITAVVSAFLYLRIMLSMYLGSAPEDAEPIRVPVAAGAAIAIAAIITIAGGLPGLAGIVDDLARDAVPQLVAAG